MTWADRVTRVDEAVRHALFDAGTYAADNGSVVMRVEAAVERGVQRVGFESQASVEHDEITFLKADIPCPKRGDTFSDGANTFEFISRITDDDNMSTWLVKSDG
jgi:hypothetical protein